VGGYGLVTFLILIFDLLLLPLILRRMINFNEWTLIKQILWTSWIIFTIGIANYFYSTFIFIGLKGWRIFLLFEFFTLTIGIIPVIFVTVIGNNLRLSANLREAKIFNESITNGRDIVENLQKIKFIASNGKEVLEMDPSNLLYIESMGNYITITHLKDGSLKKTILRCTMKRAEEECADNSSVVKCHRAYLVNVNHIVHIHGNSQGLKLTLHNTDIQIPVSRNYLKDIKTKIIGF
jgi:DNA-binding LytR/AlgR family response regulator